MPNWCINELTLYAKGKEGRRQLSEFRLTLMPKKTNLGEYETPPLEVEDNGGLDFDEDNGFGLDFNIFIPTPKKFREMDELHRKGKIKKDDFNSGEYEWRCLEWQTKWNACETRIINSNEKYIKLVFDTAWSPPIPVIVKIAERFPDLEVKLKYWEGGNAFQGRQVWKNGKLVETWEGNYMGSRGG